MSTLVSGKPGKWMKMDENGGESERRIRRNAADSKKSNLTKFDERKAWDLWCFFNHLDIETLGPPNPLLSTTSCVNLSFVHQSLLRFVQIC